MFRFWLILSSRESRNFASTTALTRNWFTFCFRNTIFVYQNDAWIYWNPFHAPTTHRFAFDWVNMYSVLNKFWNWNFFCTFNKKLPNFLQHHTAYRLMESQTIWWLTDGQLKIRTNRQRDKWRDRHTNWQTKFIKLIGF